MEKENKSIYIFLAIFTGILLIFNLLFMLIVPPLIIVGIFIGVIQYYTIRKIININKKDKERQNIEKTLLKMGYRKVHNDLFIDEKNKKLNILGKEYEYSQIIDCELIEKKHTNTNSFGITNGQIKSNGKIRMNTFSTQTNYYSKYYISITIKDFSNPNVTLNIKEKANEILSLLKVIIHQNNTL